MTYPYKAKVRGVVKGILHCSSCQSNQQMRDIERNDPSDPKSHIVSAICENCDTPWSPQTYAIASGYEYNCPFCGHLDTTSESPLGDILTCEKCGNDFDITEVTHCQ